MNAYTNARRKERLNNILFLGTIMVCLSLLVALAAPRFSAKVVTPKDAQVEHTYRETYLDPTVAEDSKVTIDSLARCSESAQLTCAVERNAQGNLEVIGTPTTTSTTQAPAPQAAPAQVPARPQGGGAADLTVSTPSTTEPSYRDEVIVPPLDPKNMLDCTTHGDPFDPRCQEPAP